VTGSPTTRTDWRTGLQTPSDIRAAVRIRPTEYREQVVSPLLVWAFRWVDDFSSDIIAARREWWQLHANGVTTTCLGGKTRPPTSPPTGSPLNALKELLDEYRSARRPLPGVGDGTVNRMFLARQLRRRHPFLLDSPAREMIAPVAQELGVSDASYLLTAVNATLDGQPWLPAFTFAEMPHMSRLLQAACYVVIAYLSGMRDSEKRAELRLMQHSAIRTTS